MANPGIAPADLTTPVGKFRQNTADLTYVDLVPPVTGQGDYTHNSDAEIEGWIAQGGDSVSRALGYYFQVLAGQAALVAHNIKDTDLASNTEKRAELLSKTAEYWFGLADAEDELSGVSDVFDSFRFNGDLIDAHSEGTDFYLPGY